MRLKQETAFCPIKQIEKQWPRVRLLLTPPEIRYCLSKKYFAEPAAARIAAKKAVFSLLKISLSGQADWMRQIQIAKKNDGKPYLKFSSKMKTKFKITADQKWFLSVAHERDLAAAYVACLEKEK